MDKNNENTIIGYSIFMIFEECYEYIDNACFIAESPKSAVQFIVDCGYNVSNYRVDKISMSKMIRDFGCSMREYALEGLAFEKFKKIADEQGINYTVEDFELDENLKIVELRHQNKL